MRTANRICARCGKAISIGDDYVMSPITGDKCFCSVGCMEKEIKSEYVDDIIDEYLTDKVDWYTEEPDDPYDRYGVSRSDFF